MVFDGVVFPTDPPGFHTGCWSGCQGDKPPWYPDRKPGGNQGEYQVGIQPGFYRFSYFSAAREMLKKFN